jgi:putative tricarboxylic transport membrane protein
LIVPPATAAPTNGVAVFFLKSSVEEKMQKQVDPKADILLAVGMIIFSAIVYQGSLELPPPRYEPLGSGAIPKGLAAIMTALSILLIIRALPHLKSFKKIGDQITDVTPRPKLSALVLGLTAAFIAVLDFEILTFIPAGIIYMTAVGYFMTHGNFKRLPYFFAFSVAMVVGNYYLFTKIFYIDLP